MTRRSRVLPVLAAAAVLAACANNNIYSAEALEQVVVDSQDGKTGDLEVGGATCPDDVALEGGVTVECTIELEGVDAPYSVTLDDVEAEEVAITVEPLRVVIPAADAAAFVTENLQDEVATADVTCGDGEAVILAETGDTIACTVAIGSETRDVELEVVDEDGTVELVE